MAFYEIQLLFWFNFTDVCFYGTNWQKPSYFSRNSHTSPEPMQKPLSWHPSSFLHDDVIKWKQFLRYWPFVQGIHRWPVNSPHKGQWRGSLMFSLICVWISGWVNNREAGDLRPYRTHCDVTAWCRQATSHFMSQCWPRSMSLYGVTRPQSWQSVWFYSPFTLSAVRDYESLNKMANTSQTTFSDAFV